MRVRPPTRRSCIGSAGSAPGNNQHESNRRSRSAGESGSLRTDLGISIVILILVVLAAVVLMRLQRPRDIPSNPSVGAPRPAVSQPSGRTSEKLPRIELPHTAPTTAKPEGRSGATTPSRPLPKPTPSAGSAGQTRRANRGGIAAIPSPVPNPRELPSEPVKTMPGIEPVAPLPVPVAPPEVLEVSPPARVFEKESTALAQVLGRYEQAYDRLDAGGAAAVWPSVDSRALARAFARLRAQDLDFGDCTFAVSATDATARCAGVLRYVQRIGDTKPKTESHVWTIEFARAGETWRIVRLTAQ